MMSNWMRFVAVAVFAVPFSEILAGSAVPGFEKAFLPPIIGPGSGTTLQFEISNPEGAAVSEVAFTDNLPAGLVIADPSAGLSSCNGTLEARPGDDVISFAGGMLAAGSNCTVAVNVTAANPGTYTNTTGDLTSSAGNSGSASAELTVATDRPGFTKSFSPDSVPFGARSTLSFTIDNSASTFSAVNLRFSDDLPDGMVVASPANVISSCGGVLFAPGGGSVISFTPNFPLDAGLDAGAVCMVSVDVKGGSVGDLGNVSSELSFAPPTSDQRSSGFASASLTVSAGDVVLTKSFVDDPVPPGAPVTLSFALRNLDRELPVTGISFTDDLGSVLPGLVATGLPPLTDPCGEGSTITGTTVITLTGARLEPEQGCSFDVTLQVPPEAASGVYENITSEILALLDGVPVAGSPASDLLFVAEAPRLTKSFLDDPAGGGGTLTLEFGITNTSTGTEATGIVFSDEFPPEISSASMTPDAGFCGPDSIAVFTPLINTSGSSNLARLEVAGASLAPGESCTFEIVLDVAPGSAAGTYQNITSEIKAMVGGVQLTGSPARDNFELVGAPTLFKSFVDDPVPAGGTGELEFVLVHDADSPGDAGDISFSDDLDATLTGLVATGLPSSDLCGPGSELSGTSTLLLSGATLAPGESCVFSTLVQVPDGAIPGLYANTTSAVTATVLDVPTMGLAATDDLRVAGLTLSKTFTNDPVLPGGTVRLRFTIENVSQAAAATEISFTDDLDSVVSGLAALALPLADPCGAGSTLSGSGSLVFQGGLLGPGDSCTFDVDLIVPVSTQPGTYSNLTREFSASIDGSRVAFDNAADQLEVAADFLALSKEFTDDPAIPGGTVNLQFTLSNLDQAQPATDLFFSDDLEASLPGLVAAGLPISACGGTVSGTSMIELTGGSLAAGASCSFDVALSVPTDTIPGTLAVNVTSQATGTIGGFTVVGDPAVDDLHIAVVEFSKVFDDAAVPGGSVTLTFRIGNLATTTPVTGLSFSDDLDGVLPGLIATGLPVSDVCGAGSLLEGITPIVMTGGSLLPAGSCSFSVELVVPDDAAPGEYLNRTSSLRVGDGLSVDPADAILTVISVADEDGDGVLDNADACPGTVIPEGVPTSRLGVNRYALVDDDLQFDTISPPGGGNGPGDVFTTEDTAGCSCEQIIEERGLGEGHVKFGCSVGVMRDWVDRTHPVFAAGFEELP